MSRVLLQRGGGFGVYAADLDVREDQLPGLLVARLDLAGSDEIGPYLNARNLVIVYGPGCREVRPVNDVRPGQLAEPS